MKYVIGDLHSSYDKFMRLLDKINFSTSDEIYLLGDLFDRGDKPIEVATFLLENDNINSVFGNHDLWIYEFLKTKKPNLSWLFYNGGLETLRAFEKMDEKFCNKVLNYLENLPYIIELENFIITHNLPEATFFDKFKNENIVLKNARISGLITHSDYDIKAWDRTNASIIEQNCFHDIRKRYSDKFIIIGHTPFEEPYINLDNKIAMIDTGAFYKDFPLTALNLETMTLISQN